MSALVGNATWMGTRLTGSSARDLVLLFQLFTLGFSPPPFRAKFLGAVRKTREIHYTFNAATVIGLDGRTAYRQIDDHSQ